MSEQRTGSLTGGLGYSNSSGIFASLGFARNECTWNLVDKIQSKFLENIQQPINFLCLIRGLREINIKHLLEQISFWVVIHKNLEVRIMGVYVLNDTNTSTADAFSSIVLKNQEVDFLSRAS